MSLPWQWLQIVHGGANVGIGQRPRVGFADSGAPDEPAATHQNFAADIAAGAASQPTSGATRLGSKVVAISFARYGAVIWEYPYGAIALIRTPCRRPSMASARTMPITADLAAEYAACP